MTAFLCCKNTMNGMEHELVKKKKLTLNLKNSIRRQLKIKFLVQRIVPTHDFAQEHRRTNFLP